MSNVKPIRKGSIFGYLIVISDEPRIVKKSASRAVFTVKCTCGNIFDTTGTKLRTGVKICCNDCSFRNRSKNLRQVSTINQLFRRYVVDRCNKNNIDYSIDAIDYENICSKNCFYCNNPPSERRQLPQRKIQ